MKKLNSPFFFLAAVVAAFLFSPGLRAQGDTITRISPESVVPLCNVNGRTIREANEIAYNRSFSMFTPQGSMSAGSIFTCGKFRLYYEDINQVSGAGFDDITLGTARRNTLCAVLNYVESVVDINVNGTTDFIDLYIELSVSSSFNPAGTNDTYLATGGPYMGAGFGGTPGIFNGHFFDHATSGTDPEPGQYDGHIKVNFHQFYHALTSTYYTINYWNDYLVTTDPCYHDLYTVLLHEATHAMGFLSCIEEDPSTHDAVGGAGPSFSRFDNLFLYYKDNTNAFHKVLLPGPTLSGTVNGFTDPLNSNRIWLNDDLPPTNQPIYSGTLLPYTVNTQSLMSHLDAQILSFTAMAQESPGYQPNYVMGPSINRGQLRRTWTLAELRILMDLGYALNPAFAAANSLNGTDNNQWLLATNVAGYRTNSYTEAMLGYYTPYNFMDVMTADHTMPNINTTANPAASSWTFSVGSLANVGDPNGDPLSVMPNTLFGIRGVSDGTNNHACVQLNMAGNMITFTPAIAFHGRAQFGFYLWDGHERGGLRIVTIDVLPGGYALPPGDEMVINPGLEDGTEIRQRGVNPNFEHTQFEHSMYEGVYHGINMSGGHPFNYVTNNWTIAGGDVTYEAWTACNMTLNPTLIDYGMSITDWKPNSASYGSILYPEPAPGPGNNQRYHPFNGPYNYSTLINPVQGCRVYRFECDINFEKTTFAVGQTFQFQLQFVNSAFPDYHTALYYTAPVQVTITSVAADTWQHVVFDFQYCGTASYYMNLLAEGIVTPQLVVTGTGDTGTPLTNTFTAYWPTSATKSPFIDNISLKEIVSPPPLTLNATATPSSLCAGGTTNLQALPTPYLPCNATYTWMPGGLSGHSVTTGPLSASTTFTATVNYACGQSANATVPVTVTSTPSLLITPIHSLCVWEMSVLLQATPSGGVFSGPGVVVSGPNYYFDPTLAGVGGPHTVSYTYTGPCGTLNGSIQVTVLPGNIGYWPKFSEASGLGSRTTGKGIITDADGYVYVVGMVQTSTGVTGQLTGGAPYTTNNNSHDIIVAKFSDECGLIWYKIFGGPQDDEGNDIALDANGNLFISGTVSGSYTFAPGYNVAVPVTATAAFVARLNSSDGTVTGLKHNTSLSTGSIAAGTALTVSQSTGDVYMTGTFTQTITFSPLAALAPSAGGNTDVFVVRMNNTLTSASWNTKIYSTGLDKAGAVAIDNANNLYVGCTVVGVGNTPGGPPFTAAGASGQHALIVRFNSSNAFGAGKIMGSNGNNATLNDLVCDPLGRLYFCGTFTGTITFLNMYWAGSNRQMYVTKLNPSLVFAPGNWTVWAGNSATSDEDALGITLANSVNKVYFTGYGANNCTFTGFTPSSITGTTAPGEFFVAGITTSGTKLTLTHSTSSAPFGVNISNAVTVNAGGTQYNTGHISHNTTFGMLGTYPLTGGYRDLFVARENPSGAFYRLEKGDAIAGDTTISAGDVLAYPNPSGGNVELLFEGTIPQNVRITITDISGRLVSSGNHTPSDAGIVSLDLSMCENGTYIIVIQDGDRQISKRVVIQR